MNACVSTGRNVSALRVVSFVIPCFNEASGIALLQRRLLPIMDGLCQYCMVRCEVLLIDDGSTDGTWDEIERVEQLDPRFHGIRMQENRGQQHALLRGYQAAMGDVVITMDADLQDPPELALKMIDRYLTGADLVIARRRRRRTDSWLKRLTAFGFYRMMALLGMNRRVLDCGEFRLMSRECCERLISVSGPVLFHRYTVTRLGFDPEVIDYDRLHRSAGETKYTYRRMFRLALDAFRVRLATPAQGMGSNSNSLSS